MNPLAQELNAIIKASNPYIYDLLSDMGKKLFFPKGILSQSAEAKLKATTINATIGIAKQAGKVMRLSSISSLVENLDPENYLPYAPSFGIPGLRQAWKDSLYRKNPSLLGKSISLPVVTSGITHGVSTFSDLWINPGDTVIMPDMMWGNYAMIFSVKSGATISHYKTFDEGLTRFNIESFEAAVKKESKISDKIIVLLNFPNNPSGYTVTKDEARKIADILIATAKSGTNVVAACDDAYFGLFFEEETMKESLFSLLAGADQRLVAVKLDGATKEDYVWGLRVGFITYGLCADTGLDLLHEALEKKSAGCIRGTISNCSHLSQSMVLNSMANGNYLDLKAEKFEILKARAAAIKAELKDPRYKDAWDVYPFNSGYFMCLRLKGIDAETLRVHLLENHGTGLIALGKHNLRVAFSCLEKADVKLLFDIILKGIEELKIRGT